MLCVEFVMVMTCWWMLMMGMMISRLSPSALASSLSLESESRRWNKSTVKFNLLFISWKRFSMFTSPHPITAPSHCKDLFTPSVSVNTATMLAILLQLNTVESLHNGVTNHFQATSFFNDNNIARVFTKLSQIDTDAWWRQALTKLLD